MNALAVEKMNTVEILQAMETLWDALIQDKNNVKSPDWHHDVLEERKKKIAEGTAKFITMQKLKARHNS